MAERPDLVPTMDRFDRTLARVGGSIEQRDPRAATQQVRWVAPDQPMIPEWDGETAVRVGFLANVIAFRCVQIRANAIAALPFRAGMDPDRPMEFNPNAPLAQRLGPTPGGPAPKLSARKLFAWSIAQRLVTGRMAWELELGNGPNDIRAIWPLVSSNLQAIPTTSGSEWFRAFKYGRPDDPKRLSADQVFYAWEPAPTDFRQPLSALQAARYDLSIAIMGDQYSHSFLKNGAVPAALIVTQAFANVTDRAKFRNQWGTKFGGAENAGKVAFTEVEPSNGANGDGDVSKAIDVKVLGLPQRDTQFIEQHKHHLEMVAISLGVPWSKLSAADRTYENASQEDAAFWNETLLGDARTMQDDINMDLAPRLGRELGWFDLSGVAALKVKPEPTTAKVGAPALYQSKLITKNEGRADYGLPPVEGGDEFISDAELALISAPAAEPTARSADPVPPAVADPTPAPDRRDRPAPTETRAPTAEETEQRRAGIWKRTNATAMTLERQWERSFARLFTRQETATLGRLTGKRGRQAERRETVDPSSIFDPQFWRTQTAELADDLYEAVASSAAARVAEVFGIDFDLTDPTVQEFISARSNQLAGQVTDTTYKQITAALAEGTGAGEDTAQLAERIRGVFAEATKNRSVVIARTEVVSAFNGSTAQLAALLPDDVVAAQEWIATRDGRVRPSHGGADGQVRRIGHAFDVGGVRLAYPGDPSGPADETIQCRCTLALLTPEDVAEMEADRSRAVPLDLARAIVVMAADGKFNEARMRAHLREVAA